MSGARYGHLSAEHQSAVAALNALQRMNGHQELRADVAPEYVEMALHFTRRSVPEHHPMKASLAGALDRVNGARRTKV